MNETAETPETTEPAAENKYATLLDDFKAKVTQSTTTVKDGVVKTLVDREVNKRQDKIIAALEKIQTLQKDLNQLRPDIQSFDEGGTEKQAFFSKAKNDERQKLKKQIAKLDTAINAALHETNPDFLKLNELIK